jgi:hypothetical protein
MKEKLKDFEPKHRAELEKLYEENGVGKTKKLRHNFWNKLYNTPYISHFGNNVPMRVKAMEMIWLTDNFPKDFHFC